MLDVELLDAVRADVRERPSRFVTREPSVSIRALIDKHAFGYDRARDLPELLRDVADERYEDPDDLWLEDRARAHRIAATNAVDLLNQASDLKMLSVHPKKVGRYCLDLHVAILRAYAAEQAIAAWCWHQAYMLARRDAA